MDGSRPWATLSHLPEGPYFVYEHGPGLFLGRTGEGPLQAVWDTNILIDYLKYGATMWDGEDLAVDDEAYRAELEALHILGRGTLCGAAGLAPRHRFNSLSLDLEGAKIGRDRSSRRRRLTQTS